MGFYGNINGSNASQALTFDKFYSNRYEMDSMAEQDGVIPGRYVLVDYNEGSLDSESSYLINYRIDEEHYSDSYDSTTWQKVYVDVEENGTTIKK